MLISSRRSVYQIVGVAAPVFDLTLENLLVGLRATAFPHLHEEFTTVDLLKLRVLDLEEHANIRHAGMIKSGRFELIQLAQIDLIGYFFQELPWVLFLRVKEHLCVWVLQSSRLAVFQDFYRLCFLAFWKIFEEVHFLLLSIN